MKRENETKPVMFRQANTELVGAGGVEPLPCF